MKKTNWLLAAALLFCAANGIAQSNDFNNCAAAFLGSKMIVNEYTTEGKCVLDSTASGELSLRPVTLDESGAAKMGKKIPFKIALRGGTSRTLMLLSEKTHTEIEAQKVLKQCQKGEYIVLLTTEREWSVPHAEILVR
jgi:hypothetical protein